MRYTRKHLSQESKRFNRKEDALFQNLIYLQRISDLEKKMLKKLTKSTSMSISDFIREAMFFGLIRRRLLHQVS
jgi:hypothetical protein